MSTAPTLDGLLRALAPQVVGIVSRRFGDFDSAEDAVQEALLTASQRWPVDGLPDEPRAWLVRAASRRLVDLWRSDGSRREREARVVAWDVPASDPVDRDDSLTVLLMCCHPSLTPASAISLTLRAVGGLTTAEIARAFLVPEATMAQRISRAKATIRASGDPFRMPSATDLDARLVSALHVLYLLFNEGYTGTRGADLQRVELSREAIRLTRLVVAAAPSHAEGMGLLALMLLLEARSPGRTDDRGDLVPLPQQDRSSWDAGMVAEGLALLDRATALGAVGEYQLQAAIAATHDRASTADQTDWREIVTLYGLLEQVTGSPVVTLNRAVAVAMVDGPLAAIEVVDTVEDRLGGTHRWLAVRGQLLEMAGETAAAAVALDAAAGLATNDAERRHLSGRAAALRSPPPPLTRQSREHSVTRDG
ncbi:RNA polymerase sigma factor [Terrabacter sp. 2RAF25]|uniref:RNA polymerase sigma factor n=1 Tax=Terrabacter sp. 2RAF25 TaxID=3232998 RepID=UPI003F948C79